MHPGLDVDGKILADLCRRNRVAKLESFGSRARGMAKADSDVDPLVAFADGCTPGLEFFALADELELMFGHHVDLFTRSSVERSPNAYKRQSILSAVQLLSDAA